MSHAGGSPASLHELGGPLPCRSLPRSGANDCWPGARGRQKMQRSKSPRASNIGSVRDLDSIRYEP
eukprot:scaffold699_cov231-Pinguiococcus_pyrenoidosus.AAC.12